MPATTTTSVSPACSECGIIRKSGKMSCCSRGGSWFGNCGSPGDAKFEHTWHEGIQACDGRQARAVVGQKLNAFLPKSNTSFNDANKGADMDPKGAVMTVYTLTFTPANTSIQIKNSKLNNVSAKVPIIKPARKYITQDAGTSSCKTITITIPVIMFTAVYIS